MVLNNIHIVCKKKKNKAQTIEAKRRSIERRYSTERQSLKNVIPKKKKEKPVVLPQITIVNIPENLQKPEPKEEIQIPSWRPANSWRHLEPVKKHDVEEDLSDAAFENRHAKAEEEEEMLWEKWTEMREEQGKETGGRSKSSRWREVELSTDLSTPRLRSQRVCSVLSTASSTPGRLSPTTMFRVQEICVEPVNLPPSPTFPSRSASPGGIKKKRLRTETELLLPLANGITEEEPSLRRVRSEIRRSSNSSAQQQSVKENVGEDEEHRRGRRHDSRISSSSTTNRVLKDSNLVQIKPVHSRSVA